MSLAAVKVLAKPPDPDVVRFLESVLDRARAGEVTGVLVLAMDGTGLSYSVAGISDRYTTAGWLTYAIFRLQSDT